MEDRFEIVGIRKMPDVKLVKKEKWYQGKPVFFAILLGMILAVCLACELVMTKDPFYLDLQHCNVPPDGEFLFGTDTLGRDIFSMIWYGGRVSLFIGIVSAAVSTGIAIFVGAVSACAPAWADALLMRFTEIILSIPSLLLVLFLQAVFGENTVFSVSAAIGMTGWAAMAKVIRAEVIKLRKCEYVAASKCMGGSFLHILWEHFLPGFMPSIMFMAVMEIRSAILAESTLSFMGLGLPVEMVSWGSMLSLAEKAILTNDWWILFFPGIFLTVTLLCITRIGEYIRRKF
ncbi:ABC transporter permease [bacterium D16-51]|nr:ABC transporter permease [bacterium D16-59]RKI59325.1 ABC transporter permease [bacterium D16-51]